MGRGYSRAAGGIPGSDAQSFAPNSRWQQARRAAFVEDALAAFAQRPSDLFDFEQVSEKLHLSTVCFRDLQTVALHQIVGSVGRYTEFTRAFLPRSDSLKERWQRVERLVTTRRDMPPVELYQVGEAYFVRDGNHRVSVAKQLGKTAIKAYVWEYEAPILLRPDTDVGSQLRQAAHAAFMDRTHLDRLRPEAEIRLTEPDGYEDLLREVEDYGRILSHIDGREIPQDEATALWYDMRYLAVLQTIRQHCVVDEFPDRTETDLYLWLSRNLAELDDHYGRRVSLGEAADDLTGHIGSRWLSFRSLRQAALRVKGLAGSRLADWRSSLRRASPRAPRK
jgi:hypothetical protein